MSSGNRLALGAGASLAALIVGVFLIGGGETLTARGPYLVQLPENTSLIAEAPAAITPIPTPLSLPPATTPPSDPGIWSTPAQFAPPEVE